MGDDVTEDEGVWTVVSRRKFKTSGKTFQKAKDKAQSSFGTFCIPLGVSGPRPLQEASFFARSPLHGRDALCLGRSARLTGCSGVHSLKSKVFVSGSGSGEPVLSGQLASKGAMSVSGSRKTRAGETELIGAVSEMRSPVPRAGAVSVFGSRETHAGELELMGAMSELGSRVTFAGEFPLKGAVSVFAGAALHGEVKASRFLGATASEYEGIIRLRHGSVSSPSINSSMGVDLSACACGAAALPAVASACGVRTSAALRSSASSAHASVSPLHFNSWSDTVRNSRCGGGLLPVCKSTSYTLGVGRKGPTGRRCTKGGVSGPAEDLRPVSEVEAGVNFRLAGCVRGQVVGSFSGQQPGTGTRTRKGSVVTPSLHPEVPVSLSVSPGPGKRIRQSMGWTKVCGTAQSGIWLLKGNARACMFPANLDHLRVGWKKQGSYKTAWVTPGQVCLCSYKYGHGAAVRPQTNKAIWDGVISLWGRVAPFLSPWCGKKELPTGVNLNHYDGSGSCVRWHSDNEPLFGPRDSPKLIVSLSLGNPVEFKVRRVSDSVTSSITLDHGDVLVMDGSAQSEYLHCTMPGLQGPRVNLTYRWVAQHTASCPLAGVVGCLLPSCVQGLPEPDSRFWDEGENNWSFSWILAFLLFILVSVLLGGIWMNIRKECCYSGQRPSCSSLHFPSRGRARWVGGRRWPLSRRVFYFPRGYFWVAKLCLFFTGMVFIWVLLLGMLVATREPTPCYHDAYSVGLPKGAYGGEERANSS